MKRMLLAVVGVLGIGKAPEANAQFIPGPGGFGGYQSRYASGGGLGFSFHRHGVRVTGFVGGYSSRSTFVSPFGSFGYGSGFGFGGPAWGWNSFGPSVVIVPPPIVLLGNAGFPTGGIGVGNPVVAGGVPAERPADDEPRPVGAKPGDFVVIAPRKAMPPPGGIVGEVDRVAGVRPPPVFKFDPFAVPVPLKAEVREADPAKEVARLLKLGRAAFARGEYGAAGEHFERAALTNPHAAESHFLKAHAAFAAGAYADAVAGIRTGLVLDPAWPAGTFDPKEPYGANPGAFAGHLAELRKAAAANPGEPALAFLLGYQLWFIGEKVEAKKWFGAAEKNLAAPGPIALFR